MKANTIAALVATLIVSVSAAPAVDKRDLPVLGGHSGIIESVGPLLDSVENIVPGLGGTGSGQGDDTGSSLLGGLGSAGGAESPLKGAGGAGSPLPGL